MARKNVNVVPIYTHEGAKAKHINAEQQLRRSVMACMLWEDTFYEGGEDVAQRIRNNVFKVPSDIVQKMAIEAREEMNLRHAPLWLLVALAEKSDCKYSQTLARVIQRADELSEFLALYWAHGKTSIAAQVKKGLAEAFKKFNAYQLAKYNKSNASIKLRDVIRLCHARPENEKQSELWKQLLTDTLPTPDTWEVEISAKGNNRDSWERLLNERKLGALALLRNLRNMEQHCVDYDLIKRSIENMNVSRVLPFRFIAAARYAPRYEPVLEQAMFKSISDKKKINGQTIVLVDVSQSMDHPLSSKSDMLRADAACGVAMVARELCEDARVFSFSRKLVEIPARRGFALRDAIVGSQAHTSTQLGDAVNIINNKKYDRLIVITDEQANGPVPDPSGKGYMINVASYQNGVGYGPWIHIDGFSEAVINYICSYEET